jgi:hypothetical protein
MIHVEAEQPMLLENGDIILRRLEYFAGLKAPHRLLGKSVYCTHGTRVISGTSCGQSICFIYKLRETGNNQLSGLGIIFGRLPDEAGLAGKLFVWIISTKDSAAEGDKLDDNNGVTMVTEQFLRENWSRWAMVAGANESKYYHVMEPLSDSWILDIEPLLKVSIKVERQPIGIGREEGVVDILDLIVSKRDVA